MYSLRRLRARTNARLLAEVSSARAAEQTPEKTLQARLQPLHRKACTNCACARSSRARVHKFWRDPGTERV